MADRPDPRLARTRARALDAAYALLVERGSTQVTVDEVSERSGVSKSTLYRHWASRDELLRDAFHTHALTAASSGADLSVSLHSWARTVAEGLERAWGRAAASLAVEALDDAGQREAQQVYMRGLHRDARQITAAAAERGELVLTRETDRVLDRLLAALFFRYLFTEQRLDRAFVRREVEHALAQLRGT